MKKKVIVVLGPTATGKSKLAVEVAKKINGEIISADSRQVYNYLDVGTGKITKKEMKGVPHHLINVVSPKKKFTVVEYKEKSTHVMIDIIKKGKIPIICGGTGFYIDSITKGIVFPEVPPNFKLRKELDKKSPNDLFKILKKIDRARARDIKQKNEINNKVRIIRAIEIAKDIGKVPKLKEKKPPYKFIKIGLYLPSNILKEKITKRVKKMFEDGLLLEIKKLKNKGISKKRIAEFGFEYNEPTVEKVISLSIKYAKRQMTWFKKDKEILWLDASRKDLKEKVLSLII